MSMSCCDLQDSYKNGEENVGPRVDGSKFITPIF